MEYTLRFAKQALDDIDFHKKAGNKAILKKIAQLLDELTKHPLTGTGKPEQLKYELVGLWSRRINKEHRLIYKINEAIVEILSAKGHY